MKFPRYITSIFLRKRIQFFCAFSLFLFISTGCKKLVEVDAPVTSVNAGNVYNDNTTAAAVLTGIYAKISSGFGSTNLTALSYIGDLSADNLSMITTSNSYPTEYYQNNIGSSYANGVNDFWRNFYFLIYTANAAIEGLTPSTSLDPVVKQRALGEAYFIRAFNYFYLLNLYGEVPLALSTDYNVNSLLPRASSTTIYDQIIKDLKQAKDLLDDQYVDATLKAATTERVRPNRQAASAMLARVYLFAGKYDMAESEASSVISQSTLFSTTTLGNVFLKNSKETIWSLQPVKTNFNTDEGNLFIPSASGLNSTNPAYISSSLLNSFEVTDQRKTSWLASLVQSGNTYFYPYKYKVKTATTLSEYTIVLRLAEQYLIRAEARTELNNISGAQSDLNVIRTRAGLTNTTASTQATLRTAILKERRVELFSEWGHRWLDLKRTGNVNTVMTTELPIKGGGTWQSFKSLYPIPLSVILASPNLSQNPGY